MIIFPIEFKAIKGHPGYFFNTTDECVYSIKIGGVLKKLSKRFPNRWTGIPTPYYELYNKGRRRCVEVDTIRSRLLQDHTIAIAR